MCAETPPWPGMLLFANNFSSGGMGGGGFFIFFPLPTCFFGTIFFPTQVTTRATSNGRGPECRPTRSRTSGRD